MLVLSGLWPVNQGVAARCAAEQKAAREARRIGKRAARSGFGLIRRKGDCGPVELRAGWVAELFVKGAVMGVLLIAGVALWWGAHLFKRVMPGPRAALGNRGKAVVAMVLVVSVVLMVAGYRGAETGTVYWGRNPALVGINNLLMLIAFYIYAVGGPKGARIWLGTKLRHPQLTGFAIWAAAHLLVNGDMPSFVLFGGLLVWAMVEMATINKQDGPWTPPPRAPRRKEFIYIAAALVAVGAVMALHNWLGVQPWG
jgi:uncharacterized membrane protein